MANFALLGTDRINMKVWLSSMNKNRKIESEVMIKELVFKSTCVLLCPLCVGQAELTVLNKETNVKNVTVVIVNFRKLMNKDDLNKLKRHESENALKSWKIEKIEELYPKLCFISHIETHNDT